MTDEFRLPPDGVERVPPAFASRLLMGGPVTLVTTTYRGKSNVMPLAWHAPLSGNPPLIGISIEQSRYSVDMIQHSQEFALNFPTWPLLHHVQYLGAMSGDRIDKFEATQLETFTAARISAPLIEGCAAWIECAVEQVVPIGDHVLFVGTPLAVQVDREAFGDRWLVGTEEKRPLHFLGANQYAHLDRVMEARTPARGDAPEAFLGERLAEELELTREARERREEQMGQLREEIESGKAVDLASLAREALPEFARRVQILGPDASAGGDTP